ncbi:MAG: type II toxin-antitoxin system HicB family antitoxin [Bacteroidetes bacterium]|nr:type II toxin-antitoxin system HicB family antitoxin [Bacteroidota bacterium]
MSLSNFINVIIRNGEQGYYVAECLEVNIVTQGKTLDELIENLKEAVELFFEDENPADFGFSEKPNLSIKMEIEPEYA